MLPELKLVQWLEAGIAAFKASPLLTEFVFFDLSQVGMPEGVSAGSLVDTTKRWIPHEFKGGMLRYGNALFPLVDNTAHELTLTGDPSLVDDSDGRGYRILPPMVAELQTLLANGVFVTLSTFAQVPTKMPAFTIRLERDAQAEAYLGETLESYVLDSAMTQVAGVEVDVNTTHLAGNYVISIWATNRLETLWLYAMLVNYYLRSQQQFATWGWSDVGMQGSDLDPAVQFLPEQTYVRHLLLTATRQEQAINTVDIEYITSVFVTAYAQYAQFHVTIPEPLP